MLIIVGGIVLGLLIGSFLNVVIYRLPVMMEREWRQQCQELLHEEGGNAPDDTPPSATAETFNLMQPRSRCSKWLRAGMSGRWSMRWWAAPMKCRSPASARPLMSAISSSSRFRSRRSSLRSAAKSREVRDAGFHRVGVA